MTNLKLVKRSCGVKTESFRLLDRVESHWKAIGEVLGLEHVKLEAIKNGKDKDSERIVAVFTIWMENACELPRSKYYPLSWQGLRTLLYDAEVAEIANQYFEFLESIPCSQWPTPSI